MNFKQPLSWYQGQFLQPQHFQAASYHNEQLVIQYMRELTPYPWGVARMQLEEQALAGGVVELRYIKALFEDGTLVEFPDNAHVRSRSVDGFWDDRTQPLKVYLGLSKLDPTSANVTEVPSLASAPQIHSRYVGITEGAEMSDLHQGNTSTSVKTLQYALALYFESEIADLNDKQLMPLFALEQHGEEILLSEDCIAPVLKLSGSALLMSRIKGIRDELLGRSKQLENYKNTPTSRAAEFNPVAERYRSALRLLAHYAPMLQHWFENPGVHPADIYGCLRSLIGELSTFSHKVNLLGESTGNGPSLPRYNHNELAATFLAASNMIVSLLDELTVSPELLVRFNRDGSNRFSAELPSEFFARQNDLYLMLESSRPYAELAESFEGFAKLGASKEIDIFSQRAIPGITLRLFPDQPTGLERRPKVSYFTLDRDSEKWKSVSDQGQITLLWDDAPADLVVEMVVVRG
ncbi:type VI secretion system baseplate subunit TssK [Oceanobacter mangrovi]|uniref:type VI secretion system baseplate subunit TssK n=1 Tax=Oceanobacter mangrovi TaxID=2862510 RepID=UPI001C8D02FE